MDHMQKTGFVTVHICTKEFMVYIIVTYKVRLFIISFFPEQFYTARISVSCSPCSEVPAALPYIGAYLDQIYSLEMCTKTYNKDGLVNFTKTTKVSLHSQYMYLLNLR